MIDQKDLRSVLGQFATGVTIITTKTKAGNYYGFTANSFTSVSLDPPLILFCIDKNSEGCPLFWNSRCFAVNILEAGQAEISQRFADSALSSEERFADLMLTKAKTGSPILADALGWLDCRLENYYEGGDHWIFVGRVIDIRRANQGLPLLYFGGYRFLKEE